MIIFGYANLSEIDNKIALIVYGKTVISKTDSDADHRYIVDSEVTNGKRIIAINERPSEIERKIEWCFVDGLILHVVGCPAVFIPHHAQSVSVKP